MINNLLLESNRIYIWYLQGSTGIGLDSFLFIFSGRHAWDGDIQMYVGSGESFNEK